MIMCQYHMIVVHNYTCTCTLSHVVNLTLLRTDDSTDGLKLTQVFFTTSGATSVVAITLRFGVSLRFGTIIQYMWYVTLL